METIVDSAAGSALPVEGSEAELASLAPRLATLIRRQVAAIEDELETGAPAYDEKRIRALLMLTKSVQAMEEAAQKQQKADDDRHGGPRDIVEFRERLAASIAALVERDPEDELVAGAGPGRTGRTGA
ncbi:MAG: hypothetical protein R3D32_11300 [Nitratireductor sp.]